MDIVENSEGVKLTSEDKDFILHGFETSPGLIDIERLYYASNLNKAKQYDVTNLCDHKNTEISERDFV